MKTSHPHYYIIHKISWLHASRHSHVFLPKPAASSQQISISLGLILEQTFQARHSIRSQPSFHTNGSKDKFWARARLHCKKPSTPNIKYRAIQHEYPHHPIPILEYTSMATFKITYHIIYENIKRKLISERMNKPLNACRSN